MPVIALSEIGLIIDVFGKQPIVHKSIDYVINNNKLISYFKDHLKFIDLLTMNIMEVNVGKIKSMKISLNGIYSAVLTFNNKLIVFENHTKIHEFNDIVENFDINNKVIYYFTSIECCIVEIKSGKMIFKTTNLPKQISMLKNDLLILMNNPSSLIYFRINSTYNCSKNTSKIVSTEYFDVISEKSDTKNILYFDKCNKITSFESNEGILILAETNYSSVTYFAELSLYYLINNNDGSFKILLYKNLGDILDVGFLKNNFFVCSGKQPSNCILFDKKTGYRTKFIKKTIRNFIAFNKSENRILCGGYGNLPGIITILENNQILCKFESLGSSVFKWLNDGTHFIVATTSYFKEGNKIDVYTYYGDKRETMECKTLFKVDIFGPDEPEKILTPSSNISQKTLDNNIFQIPSVSNINDKIKIDFKKDRNKSNTRCKKTIDQLQKELSIAIELRKKMQSGEELSIEEQNMVFSINELMNELETLKSNK